MQNTIQVAPAVPLIVAVRKLAQVQRQIFARDVMELPVDRALYDRPKSLDRVGVRSAEQVVLDVGDRVVDAPMCDEVVEPSSSRRLRLRGLPPT